MKNKVWIVLAIAFAIFVNVTPIKVKADTGPKPSITVEFTGFEDEECYVTILSKYEHSAWRSVFEGDVESVTDIPERVKSDCQCNFDIWKKFVTYQDKDGMYFLQMVWNLKEAKEIRWGYYPPDVFKVLLYFPATDSFVQGAVTERKAFYSTYSVDKSGVTALISAEDAFELEEKYDFSSIVISIVLRLLTTLVIELLIALLFGYRKKYQLLTIAVVNLVTQVFLNGYLGIREYYNGEGWRYLATYIFLEAVIFVAEAFFYAWWLEKRNNGSGRVTRAVLYAVIANFCSVAAGVVITNF